MKQVVIGIASVIAVVGCAGATHGASSTRSRIVGSTTTMSATTTPRGRLAASCTDADATRIGFVPMPRTVRLTKTRDDKSSFGRLDPPDPTVRPRVPAAQAWGFVQRTASPEASYEIVLTSYSAFLPSTAGVPAFWHRLVWVVIGHHVPSVPIGAMAVPLRSGQPTARVPTCFFETQRTLVDANTGQELEQTTGP
jgi:hypothetical protein